MCVLQHASNLEQKQNETENRKVHGDVVKYGTVLQVNDIILFFNRNTFKRLNMNLETKNLITTKRHKTCSCVGGMGAVLHVCAERPLVL